MIGAGAESIYATVLGHRRDEERGLLVLMGMAAGLSAIFRSPTGAAFFAVEVLQVLETVVQFEASLRGSEIEMDDVFTVVIGKNWLSWLSELIHGDPAEELVRQGKGFTIWIVE